MEDKPVLRWPKLFPGLVVVSGFTNRGYGSAIGYGHLLTGSGGKGNKHLGGGHGTDYGDHQGGGIGYGYNYADSNGEGE